VVGKVELNMAKKRGLVENYSVKHFQQRALERYNKDLSERDYHLMSELILQGSSDGSLVLQSQDKDTEIYTVEYMSEKFIVVWSKALKCITTLLSPDTVVKENKKEEKKQKQKKKKKNQE
jgi:hypothetical protein